MLVFPQDANRRYGLFVVISAWLGMFCLFGYRTTFAILKIPMAIDLGWSQSQITLGYSFMMLCYAISAFFCGVILDRFGSRLVYLIGAFFGAIGFCGTSMIHTLFAYYFTYGIFAGVATGMLWVSATVSVRKWYSGTCYARMFGWAYMGQSVSQIVMCLFVKQALATSEGDGWRSAMHLLGVLVFAALILAALLAKNSPEKYDMQAFGEPEDKEARSRDAMIWSVRKAFSTYPIWGVILTFLTSMLAEFLIWAQVVSYWIEDLGFSLNRATSLYVTIGIVGIFSMPLMGVIADKIATRCGSEAQGRRIVLIIGPLIGALACSQLLRMNHSSFLLGLLTCALFAVYWAVVPGGVVGYAGAIYGRITLGKIWGLATMIVMGIGPFIGPLIGGYVKDTTGSYRYSIIVALCSFVLSAFFAFSLPERVKAETTASADMEALGQL